MTGAWFVLGVTFAALAWLSPAVAGDAAELIKEGVALRRQGNDAEALRKFQQAYETDKSARVLAQMGLAEQALGRWVAAYEHLNEALEAKNDGWITKNRSTITDALGVVGDHVGRIEILGGTGAEVRIDGVLRGTLPLKGPLTMTTGTVTIDLSATGFVPVQRTAVVRARQTSRESFDALAAVTDRGGASPAGPKTATTVTKRDPATLAQDESPRAPSKDATDATPKPADTPEPNNAGPSPVRGAAKWVAFGLGAASAGLGVYGFLKQNQAADDFRKGCGVDPAGNIQMLPGSNVSLQGCLDLQGDVDSNFRLELVGFIGAAVFAGAGIALWLTESQPSEANSGAVACFPGLTPAGGVAMGCSFRL